MKRIKLSKKIADIVQSDWLVVKRITKLVSENYRRRIYKKPGYCCNSCGEFLKPNKVCTCVLTKGEIK